MAGLKYLITPVAKPRMSQRDKFRKRPAVLRYRAFCDECRLKKVQVPVSGAHVTFHVPMPKSWSGRKKRQMIGKPHEQKPDIDNLLKSVLDAVYQDDSCVWDIRVSKVWADVGAIEIK